MNNGKFGHWKPTLLLVVIFALVVGTSLGAGCLGFGGYQPQCNTITIGVDVFDRTDAHVFYYSVQLLKTVGEGTPYEVGDPIIVASAESYPGTITLTQTGDHHFHLGWNVNGVLQDHDVGRFDDWNDHSVSYTITVDDHNLDPIYTSSGGLSFEWLNNPNGHWKVDWDDRFHHHHTEQWDSGTSCAEQHASFTYTRETSCSDVSCPEGTTCDHGVCVNNQCGPLVTGYTCTGVNRESCPNGYTDTLNGITCTRDATAGCPNGYYQSNGVCKKSNYPNKGSTVPLTYSCPNGYTVQGDQCVKVIASGSCPSSHDDRNEIHTCVGMIPSGNCPSGYSSSPLVTDFGSCPGGYQCTAPGVCVSITPPGGIGGQNIGGGESGGGGSGSDASGLVQWFPNDRAKLFNAQVYEQTTAPYGWSASNTTDAGNFIEIFSASGHLVYGPELAIGTNVTISGRRVHAGSGSYFINMPTTPQNDLTSRWIVVLLGIDPIDGPIPQVLSSDRMFVKATGSTYTLPTTIAPTPTMAIVVHQ